MDVTVIATYRCDAHCTMCHVWKHPTLPGEEIDTRTCDKIPAGLDNLNITGGEPTLRRDLRELVDVLYPKARTLEISSNGLHADRLEPIVRKYPDIKIRFSLETADARSDRIRGERGGFEKKVRGLRRLRDLGATDLGFAAVIQDANADGIVELYRFATAEGFELATSALHNGYQFHKSGNRPYDRVGVARQIGRLIEELLRTFSVKDWFRAYLNLGLMAKTLGQGRLLPCTAASDFVFLDPWSDVYGCNVRPDLVMGNLKTGSWDDVLAGAAADRVRESVATCSHNCWMVTTARAAMRNRRLPALPKGAPLRWVVANRLRVAFGIPIPFERYVDYAAAGREEGAPSLVDAPEPSVKRSPLTSSPDRYAPFGPYFNR
jgi:MoaA/NifB/PqqE/SkfB family radical SAM enzyme